MRTAVLRNLIVISHILYISLSIHNSQNRSSLPVSLLLFLDFPAFPCTSSLFSLLTDMDRFLMLPPTDKSSSGLDFCLDYSDCLMVALLLCSVCATSTVPCPLVFSRLPLLHSLLQACHVADRESHIKQSM